jgi:hypothetical protein
VSLRFGFTSLLEVHSDKPGLFDLFNALGNLSPDEYRAGKLLLTRIGAMPSTLCLLGRVTTLFRVRSRLRARACSRPETPILPTRFHEEPLFVLALLYRTVCTMCKPCASDFFKNHSHGV